MRLMFPILGTNKLVIAILSLLIIYLVWPINQIEKEQKPARREPTGDFVIDENAGLIDDVDESEEASIYDDLYEPIVKPVRGSYNPDTGNIEVPQVINPTMIDDALRRLSMRPLRKNADEQAEAAHFDFNGVRIEKYNKIKMTPLTHELAFTALTKEKDLGDSGVCKDLEYISQEKIVRSDPLAIGYGFRFQYLKDYLKKSGYAQKIAQVDLKHMKKSDWYMFSGSATWLPDVQCYIMASRLMYAPKLRGSPVVSLIWMQLFDKEWKELIGRRIRYLGVTDEEVDNVLRDVSLIGGKGKAVEHRLDKISIKFPTVLDIPFIVKNDGSPLGPEDPRIISKGTGTNDTEPIILFNMLASSKRRSMFAAFPLQKPAPSYDSGANILQFRHGGSSSLTIKAVEKNWMPFFENPSNPTEISFLYSIDPLVMFRCSLRNGKCEKVQDDVIGTGSYDGLHKHPDTIVLRGGTNLMPVPQDKIRKIINDDSKPLPHLWVGFLKTHAWNCGCGTSIYRPIMYILSKVGGVYRVDLMTESLDFDMDVLAFNGKDTKCGKDGPNVLTPNSIPFWDIKEKAHGLLGGKNSDIYNDFMGLTISEADRNVKLIFLRNVMNYIAGLYQNKHAQDSLTSPHTQYRKETRDVERCVLRESINYCKRYARSHS